MDKKRQKSLDFTTKLHVIQYVQNEEELSSVAGAFSIPRSMLITLLWNRVDITWKAAGQSCKATCCLGTSAFERSEKTPYVWFLVSELGTFL